jgi:hypothetical protein
METLHEVARRLDQAADTIAHAAVVLDNLALDARAFAADAGGQIGDVGRAMHAQWASALAARSREAAAAGARVSDIGETLRIVATGYTDADEAAWRRHRRST